MKTMLFVAVATLMIMSVVVLAPDADAETPGTIMIEGQETVYANFEDALNSSTDGDTLILSDGVFEMGSGIVINKSVSVRGSGDTIVHKEYAIENQAHAIKYEYKEYFNVTVSNITFSGYAVSGLLKWEQSSGINSGTARLTVSNCTFTGTEDRDCNAGVGLFGNTTASSEVLISNCNFMYCFAGIFLDEELDKNNNMHLTVTGCSFENSYAGVYGTPILLDVIGNVFEPTLTNGLDLILNSSNMAEGANTEVVIRDNIIDSQNGINMAPYKLNPNNGTGNGETMIIRSDNMPLIRDNVRNTDTNLVSINGYRPASDELLVLDAGIIDLNGNYAAGGIPAVVVDYSRADTVDGMDAEKLQQAKEQAQKAAAEVTEYYLDSEKETTNNDPVLPPMIWDDEYVPPSIVVQPQNSSDDDVIAVVACAAAAVVAVLMATFLILDRRN